MPQRQYQYHYYDVLAFRQAQQHQWMRREHCFITTSNITNQHHEHDDAAKSHTSQSPWTPAHLRDTLTILRPQYWHLSPIWGAVLQRQTTLLANLRSWHAFVQQNKSQPNNNIHHPSWTRAHELAHQLFFQPHAGATMRVTRTKSLPASYLTPTIMGQLMGCQGQSTMILQEQQQQRQNNTDKDTSSSLIMAQLVRDHCRIRSNYVHGKWTGVSMARWQDLLTALPPMSLEEEYCSSQSTTVSSPSLNHVLVGNILTSLVWSTAVWDVCQSKRDVWEYYRAIQEVSGKDIFLSPNERLGEHDASMSCPDDWTDSHFASSQLTLDPVVNALDQILQMPSSADDEPKTKNHSSQDLSHQRIAQSLEQISAFLAYSGGSASSTEHHQDKTTSTSPQSTSQTSAITAIPKPPVPHKKYSFDKGAAKPDCVEMTVREVIEFLLWDEAHGSWDLRRLPSSADERLVRILQEQVQNHNQSITDTGSQWHTLLSNLPGCEYLSVSPFGKPYELSPKLENVARVCQLLLYPPSESSLSWKTLRDLQHEWNQDHADPSLHLQTAAGTLTERVALSRQLLEHESSTLHLASGHHAIELRLRYEESANTGFATVTHIPHWKQTDDTNTVLLIRPKEGIRHNSPESKQDKIDDEALNQLMRVLHSALQQSPWKFRRDQTWSIPLAICLLGNLGLQVHCDAKEDVLVGPWRGSFLISLLTHHYRLDRRKMMQVAIESEGTYEKALESSQQVLQNAVLRICNIINQESNKSGSSNLDENGDDTNNREESTWLELLGWILTETPQAESYNAVFAPSLAGVSFDPSLEKALLSLPPSNNSIILGLEKTDWVGNGKLIARVLKWQNGDMTLGHAFRYQTWSDSLILAKMMLASRNEKEP